jgi:hypothetical protein
VGDPFGHGYSRARPPLRPVPLCVVLISFVGSLVPIGFASDIRCGDQHLVVEDGLYVECGTLTVEQRMAELPAERIKVTWQQRRYMVYARHDGDLGQGFELDVEISATESRTVAVKRSATGGAEVKPAGFGAKIEASIEESLSIAHESSAKITLHKRCEAKLLPDKRHFVAIHYLVTEYDGIWSPVDLNLWQAAQSVVSGSRPAYPFYRRVKVFQTALCDEDFYDPDLQNRALRRNEIKIMVYGKELPSNGIPRPNQP